MTADLPAGLAQFQVDVAHVFFDLPEATGFLLAGGAALLAQGLTVRPTSDLDIFTSPGRGRVPEAADALAAAAAARSWDVERERVTDSFARLFISSGADSVAVDLAVDSTPDRPPVMSVAGPTLDPEDLAGRKLLALFNRASARDFADVFDLARRYGTDRLLSLAHALDAGFNVDVLADMLQMVRRFRDTDIPADDPAAVRAFATEWAARLRSGS